MPTKPLSLAQRLRAKRPREKDRRPTAAQRGYGKAWVKARTRYLRAHPLCVVCERAADTVDHIVAHKGDWSSFWDESNWQAMCASCHSAKTAGVDGGFGNR